ncbi:MAG: hypothetical protein P1V81_10410 [Planctomycetota bacterium]|nr:hypothetical protein [Planctomycetota bacterium]
MKDPKLATPRPHSLPREAPGPRLLLDWLVEGDPLGLRRLARDELAARCLLWDADDLALRYMAIVAHRAGVLGRRRFTRPFLLACLEASLAELAAGAVELHGDGGGLAGLGLPLGFSGPGVTAACRAHNRQGLEARRAFRWLVIEGRGLDETANELGRDGGHVAREARRLLDEFLAGLLSPTAAPNDHLEEAGPRRGR